MSILAILIPLSLILLGVAVGFFVWAVRRGQFDDLDTPPLDILAEERPGEGKAGARAHRRGRGEKAEDAENAD